MVPTIQDSYTVTLLCVRSLVCLDLASSIPSPSCSTKPQSQIQTGGKMLVLLFSLWVILAEAAAAQDPPPIFQFGDSLSDTGNALIAFPNASHDLGEPPFGMTFFKHPAGRVSDGRLIIDFLATGLGLPMLNPYLRFGNTSYLNGVNFATCGAPASSFKFYKQHNISSVASTFALDTQLKWYLKFQKTSALKQQQGKFPDTSRFSRGLYVVGELGGNDYEIMYRNGLAFSQMLKMAPHVVNSVEKHIQSLYDAGARRFLVVNIPLQGCSPGHLVTANANLTKDRFGCIADFNNVNAHHNALLKAAVQQLRKELTNSSISYADFYGIYTAVLEDPKAFGIDNPYIACCGVYTNATATTVPCGHTKVVDGVEVKGSPCSNPSNFMYWNDGHFTDGFNNIVAKAFLSGQYLDPPIPLNKTMS